MGHWLLLPFPRSVEPLSQLVVLLKVELVHDCQIVRGGQVKDRATYVRLAPPHAANDAIHVIDLHEAVHFELGEVLEHSDSIDILLS